MAEWQGCVLELVALLARDCHKRRLCLRSPVLKSWGCSPDVLGRGRPGTVPGCILQTCPELHPSDVPQTAGLFLRMEPSGKSLWLSFLRTLVCTRAAPVSLQDWGRGGSQPWWARLESKAASCSAGAELGGVCGTYPQYLPILPYQRSVSACLSIL